MFGQKRTTHVFPLIRDVNESASVSIGKLKAPDLTFAFLVSKKYLVQEFLVVQKTSINVFCGGLNLGNGWPGLLADA